MWPFDPEPDTDVLTEMICAKMSHAADRHKTKVLLNIKFPPVKTVIGCLIH